MGVKGTSILSLRSYGVAVSGACGYGHTSHSDDVGNRQTIATGPHARFWCPPPLTPVTPGLLTATVFSLPDPHHHPLSQGRTRRVPLQWVRKFQRGQETEVFKRHLQPARAFLSFSILYIDGYGAAGDRSLDIIRSGG